VTHQMVEAALLAPFTGGCLLKKKPVRVRLFNAHDKLRDGLARRVRQHAA